MPHKTLLNNLKRAVLSALDQGAHPIAAWDADGTLWAENMGELFFKYQIQNCDLQLPPNPLRIYKNLKKTSPDKAFLWLAQINHGKSLEQVRSWAETHFHESGIQIFPFQQEFIKFLQEHNVDVYIVTASITWAIEPGAKRLGIPFDNVLGIHTKSVNGLLTSEQRGHLTWKVGKANALLAATKHRPAMLCSGNSKDDIALLESATHLRTAIISSTAGDSMYATEHFLQNYAEQKGWHKIALSKPSASQ